MSKNPRTIIGYGLIIFILLGASLYGLYQSREFISGPNIIIEKPTDGSLFNSPLITLEGKTKNIAFISINDRQIFTDEKGDIKESLLLQKGYNIIKIEAKDRFGHIIRKQLELVYKQDL